MDTPKTLLEATRFFADPDTCVHYVAQMRWTDGPICPNCGGKEHGWAVARKIWKCRACKKQFSVKVGTIFEDSPISLEKWLIALWLVVNAKNGCSSHELARALGVTQKSAWFMEHRIRLALHNGSFDKKLQGQVEADETFIGGKARNMHPGARKAKGRGTVGKAVVMGLLARHGEVRATVVADRRKHTLQAEIREHVEPGSALYTDELKSYAGLEGEFAHEVINHAECYARGHVHTNGLENYWSLLKRSIKGTYVSVEPFHLFRYLDEQAFRFNQRKGNDSDRFRLAMCRIANKRLTFKTLTGDTKRG